jgi:hypothetical protein
MPTFPARHSETPDFWRFTVHSVTVDQKIADASFYRIF